MFLKLCHCSFEDFYTAGKNDYVCFELRLCFNVSLFMINLKYLLFEALYGQRQLFP